MPMTKPMSMATTVCWWPEYRSTVASPSDGRSSVYAPTAISMTRMIGLKAAFGMCSPISAPTTAPT